MQDLKHVSMLAVTLALCAVSGTGYAQEAEAGSGAVPATATQQQNAAGDSRVDALSGEITVTARKFEEKAQAVPLAISAFSGKALEARGLDNINGVATFTPNMTFQSNPSFGGASSSAAIYIRGIGQKEFLPTTEPGVGVYVDGVYVARSVGAMLDLVDVDRVEVLRGPQGTLFGRNTIGGALSLTTKKPSDRREMSGQVTTGRFDRIDAKVMANLPLTNTLALRVSGASMMRDGYVQRVVDNKDLGNVNTKTGRLQLRWNAAPNLEINLSVDGTEERNNGPALTLKGVDLRSAIFNPSNLPMLPPGSPPTAGSYVINPPFDAPVDNFALLNNYVATFLGGQNCLGFAPYSPTGSAAACYDDRYASVTQDFGTAPQYSRNRIWGASGNIDLDLGPVQLKSITAYRRLDGTFSRDGDHSPILVSQFYDQLTDKQFSQELQLLGRGMGGSLKYVAGLYYFSETGNNINILDFTPVYFQSGGKFSTKSYAAFGQATYSFGGVFDITAGLRYTKDDKAFLPDQTIFTDRTPGQQLINGSPNTPQTRILPYVRVKRSESDVTPMVNLAWHITPDSMVYASFSQGFKSGGFVQRVFPPLAATPEFAAEKATAYEAGFKTQLLDRKLTINGAVFLTKYDNLQVQVFTGVAPVTKNAAAAEIKGAELEVRLSPGNGWFVEGSAGFLDPRYTSIDPAATEITKASRFERISKWTVSASLLKSIPIGESELTPRIDWSYRSGQFMDALNTREILQPGYSLVNASIAYDFPGKRLSLTGGVTNLTDERYLDSGIYGTSFRSYETLYARPREWYVSLKWKI
ncbi:TonB-dependent receptor [Novosphingobium cyanobacteriorum]|uniref:TonB-dependent receptor n=1 Tax=Novosphingobium cyanobacteriorum TaxID=3024215 RepID=A0ABT6CDB1_9SPHN|nr:TonB-dependent receptor [Novosphingobium cyanobacteriorum]MDF8331914.1 TonB-dependent receptor [Novosphingobium cyanobacteriorum]